MLHNKVTVIISSPATIPEHNNLTSSSFPHPSWSPLSAYVKCISCFILFKYEGWKNVWLFRRMFCTTRMFQGRSETLCGHVGGQDTTYYDKRRAARLPSPGLSSFDVRPHCSLSSTDNFGSLLFFGKRQFFVLSSTSSHE